MDIEEEFKLNLDKQFILSKHEILVDSTLKSLQSPEGIKRYTKTALRRIMGDDAEVSDIKLKMPSILVRLKAKLLKRTPQARIFVTTKF
jgi:hypothetical protein